VATIRSKTNILCWFVILAGEQEVGFDTAYGRRVFVEVNLFVDIDIEGNLFDAQNWRLVD
jgi:hypothetical protein